MQLASSPLLALALDPSLSFPSCIKPCLPLVSGGTLTRWCPLAPLPLVWRCCTRHSLYPFWPVLHVFLPPSVVAQPLIPVLSMLRQEEYKFRPHLGYSKTLFQNKEQREKQVCLGCPSQLLSSPHELCVEVVSFLPLRTVCPGSSHLVNGQLKYSRDQVPSYTGWCQSV